MMEDYKIVDLDLPSGTLWADKNVGAEYECDFGLYFVYGKEEGFSGLSPGWYTSRRDLINYSKLADWDPYKHIIVDPVSNNMGSLWETPTKEQIEELFKNTKKYVKESGDIRFIGGNGNSILIPASGYRDRDKKPQLQLDNNIYLWTSSTGNETINDIVKYVMVSREMGIPNFWTMRINDYKYGFPIRGVVRND